MPTGLQTKVKTLHDHTAIKLETTKKANFVLFIIITNWLNVWKKALCFMLFLFMFHFILQSYVSFVLVCNKWKCTTTYIFRMFVWYRLWETHSEKHNFKYIYSAPNTNSNFSKKSCVHTTFFFFLILLNNF